MSASWYLFDYTSRDAEQALASFRPFEPSGLCWRFDREPAECEYDDTEHCWFVGPVTAA